MNFCKDCKHVGSDGAVDAKCESPKAEKHRNPVTGEAPYASSMRYDPEDIGAPKGEKRCGKNGDWFEAKDTM